MIDKAWVNNVLKAAVSAGASDVHFKAGEPVLMRIKGDLRAIKSPKLVPDNTQQIFEALCPVYLTGEGKDTLRELDFPTPCRSSGGSV